MNEFSVPTAGGPHRGLRFPTQRRGFTWSRGDSGFTLIEILIVIVIIVVLLGLLLPAIAMVRNSVSKGRTEAMIQGIHMAMVVYQQEERQKRYPPVAAGDVLATSLVGGGGTLLTLDLLRKVGLEWRMEDVQDSDGALIDPWGRLYRYRLDDSMDGTIAKPASQPDWNAKDEEPYPYVWSLGKPVEGETKDALPVNAGRWLYKRTTP